MKRKLIALLLLLCTIWILVLAYLYFFVYYTATVTIDSNIWGYQVQFFSKSTAQKSSHTCPEKLCVISDIAPFDYSITFLKDRYESQSMSVDIAPWRSEVLLIELEKEVTLSAIVPLVKIETPKEQIQRLRAESRSFVRFQLDDKRVLSFREEENTLKMFLENGENFQMISEFSKVSANEIFAETLSDSEDIFLKVWETHSIFKPDTGTLINLDFDIEIRYVKVGKQPGEYIIITEKGAFVYNQTFWTSQFQYLFWDYVYDENILIGIVYEEEEQKRKNFNLTQNGNLIVRYNPQDKTRKILYWTDQKIERIEKMQERIIVTLSGEKFELENF